MKYILIICSVLFSGIIYGQNESELILYNTYPEGIYMTHRSFIKKDPNSQKTVEARNIFKSKEVIDDPMIDNCYFYEKRSGKKIKDAFAISFRGSLYIQIKSMLELMEKKDSKSKIDYKDSYIRVLDQGKYLYMEGYFKKGGSGIGIGIGAGPIGIGTGGFNGNNNPEELKGIIYDFDNDSFDLFRDCGDFNEFLNNYYPEKAFECERKTVPVELVRKIMLDINDGL
jgi:hypothetical protein